MTNNKNLACGEAIEELANKYATRALKEKKFLKVANGFCSDMDIDYSNCISCQKFAQMKTRDDKPNCSQWKDFSNEYWGIDVRCGPSILFPSD